MGIDKNQLRDIWIAIGKWLKKRHMTPLDLAAFTRTSSEYILKGIANKSEWITSDFIHSCMEAFVLTAARQRGIEDTIDILTDEECIDAITAILDE